MFKRSRRKIVVSIMSLLVVLFIGTLSLIFVTSYVDVSNRNYDMLKHHAETYSLNKKDDKPKIKPDFGPGPSAPNDKDERPFEKTPAFMLSSFSSVAISDNGSIIKTDVGEENVYEPSTLEMYAKSIIDSHEKKGTKENLLFYVERKEGYLVVAFMDNTIFTESMSTLFRYSFIFGCIALVAIFFVSLYLSKRIVDPLEENYQKQKRFISNAGHELKTPVSVVSANSELLSREIGDNQWLSNIQYETERMGKLVTQLLELAKAEDYKPSFERVDLSRIVSGGALPFESVAFEKSLELNTDITNNIFVNGCSTQLSQLVSILLDNAIRHSVDGKNVEISLSETRTSAVLTVVNDGPPIPNEMISRLFDRFFRVDEVRNGEDKHYGLGLSIAKSIVTTHNGKIDANCADGKIIFTVRLPKC